jgi:hypothetical protein
MFCPPTAALIEEKAVVVNVAVIGWPCWFTAAGSVQVYVLLMASLSWYDQDCVYPSLAIQVPLTVVIVPAAAGRPMRRKRISLFILETHESNRALLILYKSIIRLEMGK